MPLPTGPSVLMIGTRTLSNVTYAVPAAAEYAVLIAFVDTPGPRGINITVKPVLGGWHQTKVARCIQGHPTSVRQPVVK